MEYIFFNLLTPTAFSALPHKKFVSRRLSMFLLKFRQIGIFLKNNNNFHIFKTKYHLIFSTSTTLKLIISSSGSVPDLFSND